MHSCSGAGTDTICGAIAQNKFKILIFALFSAAPFHSNLTLGSVTNQTNKIKTENVILKNHKTDKKEIKAKKKY